MRCALYIYWKIKLIIHVYKYLKDFLNIYSLYVLNIVFLIKTYLAINNIILNIVIYILYIIVYFIFITKKILYLS